jgi:hypothetical protein
MEIHQKFQTAGLMKRLRFLEREVRRLQGEINSYYSNLPMQLMELTDILTESYSLHLHPTPVKITASSKNKSQHYMIKPDEIVCVKSDGRTKTIHTLTKLNEIGSDLEIRDMISLESSWNALLVQINPMNFHLCRIHRSIFVNVKYYDLIEGKLEINLPNIDKIKEIHEFDLGTDERELFMQIKENYQYVFKLQKKLIRDKMKF